MGFVEPDTVSSIETAGVFVVPDEQVREGRVERQRRHLLAIRSDVSSFVQGTQHGQSLEGLQQRGTARRGDIVESRRVFYPHNLELENYL